VQQIKIDDISYDVFSDLMTYLYTGKFEALDKVASPAQQLEKSIEYLRVADSQYLEDIKLVCEQKLVGLCTLQTFQVICDAADLYNANRLKDYCAWFQRINP
jgi:hypothetical protein